MKKLEKVSLFSPEGSGNSSLTREEMSALTSDYVDGYCFFYCLAYMNQTVFGASTMTLSAYTTSYVQQYGPPLPGDGVPESRAREFTAENFTVSTVNTSGMSSFVRNGNPVLAGIEVVDQQTGKISGHAVVITTYNSSDNVYGYYDPADGKLHYVPASSFRFTIGVTGVK